MTDHELRLLLKDLFGDFSFEEKSEYERRTGINVDRAPPWLIYGGLKALLEEETLHRKYQREDTVRQENYDFQAKLERAKVEALGLFLNEAARIIRDGNKEDMKKLESILASVQESHKELQGDQGMIIESSERKQLPVVSYTDCWRRHNPTESHPEGRPGPSQCIQSIPQEDGIHYRCMVAYASQKPSGFARLKYQIFHAELLRQGDCPRPLSRSISRRIPVVSWLFTRPDVCPLATGNEYAMDKKGNLINVTD
jgi:hypothetical protein